MYIVFEYIKCLIQTNNTLEELSNRPKYKTKSIVVNI